MSQTATQATETAIVSDDLFDLLDTDVAADQLDVRAHEAGFAYVQAPNGNTAEVLPADGGVVVQEVAAEAVNFDEREELDDVFGSITCE